MACAWMFLIPHEGNQVTVQFAKLLSSQDGPREATQKAIQSLRHMVGMTMLERRPGSAYNFLLLWGAQVCNVGFSILLKHSTADAPLSMVPCMRNWQPHALLLWCCSGNPPYFKAAASKEPVWVLVER